MEPVKYVLDFFPGALMERATMPPGYRPSLSGYGKKIPFPYTVKIENRRHRVYAVCYSNSGSLYILKNGFRYFLGSMEPCQL